VMSLSPYLVSPVSNYVLWKSKRLSNPRGHNDEGAKVASFIRSVVVKWTALEQNRKHPDLDGGFRSALKPVTAFLTAADKAR
jgi:hypothetical protein